jgi:hypothetical protein
MPLSISKSSTIEAIFAARSCDRGTLKAFLQSRDRVIVAIIKQKNCRSGLLDYKGSREAIP